MWLYLILLAITWWILDRIIYRDFYKARGNCPAPQKWFPVIGTAAVFLTVKDSRDFLNLVIDLWKQHGPLLQLTFLRRIAYIVSNQRDMELILSSTTLLEKGESYDFIIPWIGRGLLTSNGEKWKSRRKMLTPAFHFKILNEFVEIFNKNGTTLCDILEREVDEGPFNVYPYVQLAALDNIYETAMGVSKNLQRNPDTKFVKAVRDISSVITKRAFNPLLRFSFTYRWTTSYKIGEDAMKFLHENTMNLINQRKRLIAENTVEKNKLQKGQDLLGSKKRFAFLDLLLIEAADNKLEDSDVREEVDTFLFEGHDTVTSGLSFCIYALAQHPEIQEKAFQEQLEIFGDSERQPSFNDVQEMKYLERVIKESQRLYPSVPLIERYTRHAPVMLTGGVQVPKESQFTLFIYALHRDPEVWDDPDTFNPDNFTPEASQNRHPYAYVPFSAGPRNCIGQRFAMLELKCTIGKLLRRFKLVASPRPEHQIKLMVELVLNSKTGHHIQLQRRTGKE